MAKKIPECPPIPKTRHQARETREFQIQLVTPMFGGGVVAGEPDPTFPIRGTSIRGQLQFWWRATVGAQYETLAELRTAQSEIWGSTEWVSRVQVLVEKVEACVPAPCAKIRPNYKGKNQVFWEPPFQFHKDPRDDSLPYALFPFQGKPADQKGPQVDPACCITKLNFQLIIRCPIELWPQVEPAVWAWVNFGGIGARTRRGCGAIFCNSLAPNDATDLATMWKKHMPAMFPKREWPTVANAILSGQPVSDPIEAWDQVIGKLWFFRQGNDFARDPGNPPSRSRFPEPDTIRRITDSWKSGHEPRDEKSIPNGFPRAEFGLPIVFHFKDGKKEATDTRQLEPYDTVLQPFFAGEDSTGHKLDSEGFPIGKTKDRMASPLILKSLRLAKGQAIPLILQLSTELPQRVELQNNKTHKCLTRRRDVPIRHPEFASGSSPINGRSPEGSALEAFLKYTKQNGFTEVGR